MKGFKLLKKIKYEKGVKRVWLHLYTGNILEEYSSPNHHAWKVDGATSTLEFWVNEFKKHPKK